MTPDSPAQRIAAKVRGCVAEQRRTQSELAAALGLSQVAVSRRLNGHVAFDVDELLKVAEFLGVHPASLLPDAA